LLGARAVVARNIYGFTTLSSIKIKASKLHQCCKINQHFFIFDARKINQHFFIFGARPISFEMTINEFMRKLERAWGHALPGHEAVERHEMQRALRRLLEAHEPRDCAWSATSDPLRGASVLLS
jgi:hypothetical protein